MKSRYLTVDLILESDFNLTPLTDFLEGKVFFLWKKINNKKSTIGLESNLHDSLGPEEDVTDLLNIIEKMPLELKKMWDNIANKLIDIGYECGAMKDPINSLISSHVIRRLADLGFSINIRLYPSAEEDWEKVRSGNNR